METSTRVLCCPSCDAYIYFKKQDLSYTCYKCKRKDIFSPKEREVKINFFNRNKKRSVTVNDVRSKAEILEVLARMERDRRSAIRDQALVAYLYLTASRIEEATGIRKGKALDIIKFKRSPSEITYSLEPVKKDQFSIITKENVKIIKISNLKILKRKDDKKIVDVARVERLIKPTRNVYLDYEADKDFYFYVQRYLDLLSDNDFLFPIAYQHGWRLVYKNTGWFPHFLRHCRITHFAENGWTSLELSKFIGWVDEKMAATYIKVNDDFLIKKLISSH